MKRIEVGRDETRRLPASARVLVRFLPDTAHPYYELLTAGLRRLGVEVAATPKGFWILRHIGRRDACRVIHLHWLDPYILAETPGRAALKALLFAAQLWVLRHRGIHIVWTVHNLKNHENRLTTIEWLGALAVARLCTSLIVHCSAASHSVRRRFLLGETKSIHVIPHGHFIDRYPVALTRAEARAALGLSPDEPVLLVFGLIRPYKGLDRLFTALEDRRFRRVRLVVAGALDRGMDPDWVDRVRARYPWLVVHAEHIADEDVQRFLRAADVAVLPYRDVLTSGALVLAMGFGLPCVAPGVGCIPETLDERGGVLFDPTDDGALAGALATMLERRAEWPTMGAHNRRRAEAWDWRTIARQTSAAYGLG